jgi:VWFA-related protein
LFNNFFISAAALALLMGQSQTSVFRGSTEVVVVDVQITDRAGNPLDGFTVADFSLKVDGKPRPIASANFWRLGDRPATVKDDAFSTLGSLNPVSAESYVLFVADPGNMHQEPSRILFDQAADFMKDLDPAHAIGLLVLPENRLRHEFGVLRQPIAATLRKMTGGMMNAPVPADRRPSLDQIKTRSASLISETGLEQGIEALSRVDGRRTLVYFGDYFPEERPLLDRIALAANKADVAIYVVASDSIVIPSVTSRSASPAPMLGGEYGGLEVLANATGGKLFRRVVTARSCCRKSRGCCLRTTS